MMKKKIFLTAAIAAVMAFGLAGCGVKVTDMAIPETATIEKGESVTLPINFGTDKAPAETPETATSESATAETAEMDEKLAKAVDKLTVEWTSSDESVATVDESGVVTAVSAGEADITATVKDTEMSDVCIVTVKVTAQELNVPENLDIELNSTNSGSVEAKYTPVDATNVTVSYASSDDTVATVDDTGKVMALKSGECDIITTLMQDGEKIADKTTKVKAFYKVDKVTLDSTSGKLTVGNTHTIKATVSPAEVAAETTIDWVSSNEKVATVDSNGRVTAVSAGTATITATAGEQSATYNVTVEEAKKTSSKTKTGATGSKGTTSSKSNSGYTGSSSASTPNYSGSSNTSTGSSSAGSTPTTPAAPDPTPVQPSNPEPAQPSNPEPAQPSNPEPAPAPDPEPVQPSQPSGGTTDGSGANGGQVIEGSADKSCPPEEHEVGWC